MATVWRVWSGGPGWRAKQRLAAFALVWSSLIAAMVVNLMVVPRGTAAAILYVLPVLCAALFWSARTVTLLVALIGVLTALTLRVQAVPSTTAAAALAGLLGLGGLAVQVARLRAAVHQAAQARDAFVATAAHDLKNPLTILLGHVYLLRREADRARQLDPAAPPGSPDSMPLEGAVPTSHVIRELNRIDTAAKRTLALLNALLDAVRLEAGEALELVLRPTDLVALVRRVVATYEASTDAHTVLVQTAVPTLIGTWDAFRLERVLENLLSNAVKYSAPGSTIMVTLHQERREQERWAVVRVRDEGVGIAPEDLPQVFTPFRRGRHAARMARGTGIGLAGAQQIVAQHGGTLSAESSLGHGSTFTLRLPEVALW